MSVVVFSFAFWNPPVVWSIAQKCRKNRLQTSIGGHEAVANLRSPTVSAEWNQCLRTRPTDMYVLMQPLHFTYVLCIDILHFCLQFCLVLWWVRSLELTPTTTMHQICEYSTCFCCRSEENEAEIFVEPKARPLLLFFDNSVLKRTVGAVQRFTSILSLGGASCGWRLKAPFSCVFEGSRQRQALFTECTNIFCCFFVRL